MFCVLCQQEVSFFVPLVHVWKRSFWQTPEGRYLLTTSFITRPNRACPQCGSHERHRVQYLYLKRHLLEGSLVLEVAPDRHVSKRLNGNNGVRYTTIDINRNVSVSYYRDVCTMGWNREYDVVICCNVLEHVKNDMQALREIYTSLKPGGWTLIQIPIWAEKTIEGIASSSKERELLFAHDDHVRRYGLDFYTRMEAVGFQVKQIVVGETYKNYEYLGLDPAERLFIGEKS